MRNYAVLFIAALACFTASALADTGAKPILKSAAAVHDSLKEHACADLVKGCFARAQQDRSSCFFNASRNDTCVGTDTGSLSYKRWASDPGSTGAAEPPPAFMGPRLVDRECLSNFDNRWSGELLRNDSTAASVQQMSAQLERCYRETSIDISRP